MITELDVEIIIRQFIEHELDLLPNVQPEPFESPLLNEYVSKVRRSQPCENVGSEDPTVLERMSK